MPWMLCLSARETVFAQEIFVDAVATARPQQSLDVAGDDIDLEVHRIAGLSVGEGGVFHRMGNKVHSEAACRHFVHRKAGAVDADRALRRDIAGEIRWNLEGPALRPAVAG